MKALSTKAFYQYKSFEMSFNIGWPLKDLDQYKISEIEGHRVSFKALASSKALPSFLWSETYFVHRKYQKALLPTKNVCALKAFL